MVAQAAPANPGVAPAQPIIVQNTGPSLGSLLEGLLCLVGIAFGIFLVISFIVWICSLSWWGDGETIIETETHHYHDGAEFERKIEGNLKRKWDKGQPYVIDPVDRDKVWVNSSDDMYEDGDGKFWKLS